MPSRKVACIFSQNQETEESAEFSLFKKKREQTGFQTEKTDGRSWSNHGTGVFAWIILTGTVLLVTFCLFI